MTEHQKWTDYNAELLRTLFSTEQPAEEYKQCPPAPVMESIFPSSSDQVRRLNEVVGAELEFLDSLLNRLDLYADAEGPVDAVPAVSPSSAVVRRTPLDVLDQLANRFHLVAQQLRFRYGGRETLTISDEYDVQDLLHALLRLDFDDVRPEEHTPSYAGASARMDFLLKNEKVVVEVKCTREGLGAKEIGEQLLVDAAKYRTHQDCKLLFCFVYDPEGRIKNPRGLETDLSLGGHVVPIRVRIRPTFG